MKKYSNYLLLITITLILIMITSGSNSLFGSTTDWINQHVLFADYFRTLFYETGNLFPNLALQLGSGMNIFALSYYGLYSPWLLISYLLPGVSMATYLQAINMITYIGSVLLIYQFLIHKKYRNEIALTGAILFACASPVLYHFHRQFMFVNYFPFLILALFGVDHCLEKNKKGLLIVSLFLMIMTSFYYSVTGLIVVGCYGIYRFLKDQKKINKETIMKTFLPLLQSALLAILLAAILLLPSFFALLDGRSSGGNETAFVNYIIPNLSFGNLLYYNYAIGLPIIALVALLVGAFSKQKERKFLSIGIMILLIVPLASFILNGGLYARGKILIPFLPLLILLIAEFFDKLPKEYKKIPWKKISLLLVVPLTIVFLTDIENRNYAILFLLDVALTYGAILFTTKKGETNLFLVFAMVIALPLTYFVNRNEEYVKLSDYDGVEKEELTNFVQNTTEEDPTYYRMNTIYDTYNTMNQILSSKHYQTAIYSSLENTYYRHFYYDIMKNPMSEDNYLMLANSNNPLFLNYMGVKYVMAETAPYGYTLKEKGTLVNLYEKENVFPMFYATSKLFSTSLFNYLQYPNNLVTLLQSAIVEQPSGMALTENLRSVDLGIKEQLEGIQIINGTTTKTISLNKTLENKIILLSFDMTPDTACKEGQNRYITINGITNQQSCDNWIYGNGNHTFYYQIASNEPLDTLNVTFTEGVYEILNVQTYIVDGNILENYRKSITPMEDVQMKGDTIEGTITVKDGNYFISTLPYDEGYTVFVDGKKTDYEVVNTAFLGFPLEKGTHSIKITYQAMGHQEGKVISSIALVVTLGITIKENLPSQNNKKKKSFKKKK